MLFVDIFITDNLTFMREHYTELLQWQHIVHYLSVCMLIFLKGDTKLTSTHPYNVGHKSTEYDLWLSRSVQETRLVGYANYLHPINLTSTFGQLMCVCVCVYACAHTHSHMRAHARTRTCAHTRRLCLSAECLFMMTWWVLLDIHF